MRIICFGDSLTTCGGIVGRYSDLLADRFPDLEIVNSGVGGEAFPDALARIDNVVALKPDIVLIEYGANDWWRGERTPHEWGADLEECIRRFETAGARCVVLGCFGQ
ncbi:MAG: SGNH/GDSL hydrolase family protein, partial [Victivallales bacterium]|nr:SGNH/GDSL hydrolase family protein [Victivallales bacterium]